MFEFIGLIVIVVTIIIAGNQYINKPGIIFGIILVGLSILNLLSKIKEIVC